MPPPLSVRMNTGAAIPQVGYGAFKVDDALTAPTVLAALETGYRSIDTAATYGNEEGIGRAVAQSGLPRDEVFLTTKLSIADMRSGRARLALEGSLRRLRLDVVDLYLLHWPTTDAGVYVAAWEALQSLRDDGLTRAIGVCNFGPRELDRLVGLGGAVPAVNQIELHPRLRNRAAEDANRRHGIVTEAWGPLARGAMTDDPTVARLAAALGRTPAQVILRWHLQQGRVVIPKSASAERMRENLEVDGFELSASQLAAIDVLDRRQRLGPDPRTKDVD